MNKDCKAEDHPGGVGMTCECGNAWLYDMPKPECKNIVDGITRCEAVVNLTRNETAADILETMAKTYRERNAIYGDNYQMVGPMMKILFPDGCPAELIWSDQFHLFELIIVKLSRFAVSNLTHEDSIHDAGVYAAMIEYILTAGENKNG